MMLLCGNYESKSHLIAGDISHDRPLSLSVDAHGDILHVEHFRSAQDPSVEVFQSDSSGVSSVWRQPGASVPSVIFCIIRSHDSEMTANPSTFTVTLGACFERRTQCANPWGDALIALPFPHANFFPNFSLFSFFFFFRLASASNDMGIVPCMWNCVSTPRLPPAVVCFVGALQGPVNGAMRAGTPFQEFQEHQEFQVFQEIATHFKSVSRDSKNYQEFQQSSEKPINPNLPHSGRLAPCI